MKPKNWFESLNCAIEGILYAAKTQKHMKFHFIVAALVLLLSLFLDVSRIEFVLLAVSITLVLFAEMVNTAIEVTIDLIHEEYHPLAKIIKDVAAGGVLIASLGALVMGYMILSEPFFGYVSFSVEHLKRSPAQVTLIALILVVIAVVLMKSHIGRGKPLQGGMPSGHSAVAFSVWTAVSFIVRDPFVVVLTFVLAIMVSHSRLLLGIHTKREVVAGAMLGFLITLLLFQLFK
jgi:diacylglycerol kinase (ATP)